MGVQGTSRLCYSTGTYHSEDDEPASNNEAVEIDDSDFLPEKPNLQLQGVDPRKGWNFRGVHKVYNIYICSCLKPYKHIED